MSTTPNPAPPQPQSNVAITGEALVGLVNAAREQVAQAFVGQAEILDQILVALLAGGHVLVEGVPGLGKTLLVRALATALDCSFAARAVHARPDAQRHQRPCLLRPEVGGVPHPPRAGVHQPAARR
jgi:hypothetical protein